jgi:hypothetical protein
VVCLGDVDAAEEAGDLRVNLGVFERTGAEDVALFVEGVEPAGVGHHDLPGVDLARGTGDQDRDDHDDGQRRDGDGRVAVHDCSPHEREEDQQRFAEAWRLGPGVLSAPLGANLGHQSVASGGRLLGVVRMPLPQQVVEFVARRRSGGFVARSSRLVLLVAHGAFTS